MREYLELDGIGVSYGDVVALPPLSLSIRAGEFFSLLGPSGCGKTTTLNVVAGFIRVNQGRVWLDGKDITDLPPQRRDLGVVFQSYALFPHMTAAENVGYGLRLRKVQREAAAKQVAEALALVQLDGKGDRYPRQLSGGEQQRVAIARALAINPRLLLLDEPLSNLDARLREEMRAELKRIQRQAGVTTIFVTHDQSEAFGAADRIAVLDKGVVRQVGTPSEIYKRPASTFAARFIGRSNRLQGTFSKADRALVVGGMTFAVDVGVDRDIADATLYLRPEDLKLGVAAPNANTLPGHVAGVVYGGSTVDYRVTTAIGDLDISQFADQTGYEVGDAVTVSWSGDSGALLQSEAR